MKINKKKITAAVIAVIAAASALTGCAGSDSTETSDTEGSSSLEQGSYTTADVQALLENASETTTAPEETEEVTFSTVTDVENEVDRAIYKTQIELPEGWAIVENSKDGKYYASMIASLTIQAQNYGADAELTSLDTLADSVAASIVMQNMFRQADTKFGEPQQTTVAGVPAVRYDYTVTAYMFEVDDEGKKTDKKTVIGEYKDRLYVLYYGTDAYCLQFEAPKDKYDEVSPEFDAMIESFSIAEDGTAGYEAASIYMSEFESYSMSSVIASIEAEQSAMDEAGETVEVISEETVVNSDE